MHQVTHLLKLISIVFLSIVLSVGIIGISYSYFTGANTIQTNASMGDIDIVFSNLYIDPVSMTDPSCGPEAKIVNNGKGIEITIENAIPNYNLIVNYEVTNIGSVPVNYKLQQTYCDVESPVQLDVLQSSEYICENGGISRGQLIVTVNDQLDQTGSCDLYTELNFQQVIVESR